VRTSLRLHPAGKQASSWPQSKKKRTKDNDNAGESEETEEFSWRDVLRAKQGHAKGGTYSFRLRIPCRDHSTPSWSSLKRMRA
jgi:hypothetical protein